MTVFELMAKIGLDDSAFQSGMNKAESTGESLSNKLSNSFNKLKKVAVGVFAGAVVKKGISTLREFVSETAEVGERIDKQSQVLGMSRKAYQEWDYILSQNGASIESMGTAMKTLNSTILNGIDDSEEAKDAFAQLGLSVDELSNLSQEQQFEEVVRAFQKMPAGAQKSALAVKLFGKQGMQLLPLLNSESTSIDELRQRAEELGLIMSDDAIDAAAEYDDALDTMKRTFDSVKYSIGSKLLPVVTNAMTKITDYAGKLKSAYEENGIIGVFETLRTDFSQFVESLQNSDNPVLQVLGNSLSFVQTAIETIVGLFTNFDETVDKLQESDNLVLQVLGGAIVTVKDGIDGIIQLINGDWVGAINTFKDSDSTLLQTVGDIADTFVVAKGRIQEAIDKAKEFFGVPGSNKSLYGKYTAEMGHEYSQIKSDSDLTDWVQKLKKGMYEAGFDASHVNMAGEYFKGLDYTNPQNQQWVSEALSQLSNPLNFDKEKVIENWQSMKQWNEEHKDELKAPVEPETTEEQLKENQEKIQKYVDANPITQKIILQNEGVQNAPEGYLWQGPDGSNAKGLWSVPWDGFLSELHRGEMVLSASQARDYRDGGTNNFNMSSFLSSLSQTVKSAIENATVRSYLNGKDITDEVNRNNINTLKSKRYAT